MTLWEQFAKVTKRNGDILAYGNENIKSASIGKNGFGSINIAIPNKQVRYINDYAFVLIIVNKKELE